MEKQNPTESIDDLIVVENKNVKRAKILNALLIGFLAGIVGIGVVSAFISGKFIILIPLLFPLYFSYKLIKPSQKNIS
ncbi:hypothetical protein [Psychroflexus montanilacus]|uniref:hypothetical protein n=1 Tax=Psychroflexus montanilacus TaxID=2873598 RepID=UPI001CCAD7E5|nr:hypothetical protein [Psychroflexus montanilacus]MBZ9652477.1 hypothetical protein [Psychroflexus montanilacus]